MASNLHQIQLTYDSINDRLLLSFSTQDFFEYKFWVTRRALKGLWGLLQQITPKNDQENRLEEEIAEKSIQQEVEVAGARKFGTSLARHPLGVEPMLLYKVSATPGDGKRVHFRLEDSNGRFVEFAGEMLLVSLLAELIRKVIPKTDWGLSL